MEAKSGSEGCARTIPGTRQELLVSKITALLVQAFRWRRSRWIYEVTAGVGG